MAALALGKRCASACGMGDATNISPTIVDTLYADAIDLADEARAAFDMSGRLDEIGEDSEMSRIALSCEALRTTTRMMHAIAWLLNQRAFFAGELSEFQLRRHGRLPPPQPASDPDQLSLLTPDMRELIERTKRFYDRIDRLDRAWRDRFVMQPAAVHRLRERLGGAISSL